MQTTPGDIENTPAIVTMEVVVVMLGAPARFVSIW
jgi:hypothetical protein